MLQNGKWQVVANKLQYLICNRLASHVVSIVKQLFWLSHHVYSLVNEKAEVLSSLKKCQTTSARNHCSREKNNYLMEKRGRCLPPLPLCFLDMVVLEDNYKNEMMFFLPPPPRIKMKNR
jgi:hypothetical protein